MGQKKNREMDVKPDIPVALELDQLVNQRNALEQQVTQQAAAIAELLILVKTGYEIIPYLTGLSDHAATMREEWKLKAIAALDSTPKEPK